jgi:PAS domain-containing protein
MRGLLAELAAKTRSEERLADSREMLMDMLERSPFGIYIVDSSFRIMMMTHRSQDGAFINVRPLIGRGFEETIRILCPERVAAEIWDDLRNTLETGEPSRSNDLLDPSGDAASLEGHEWELHQIRLPDGQLGATCYYHDSTELRKTVSALREQLRFTQALSSNVAAAIFITDAQHLCSYVNPAAEKLCGYSAGELIGNSMHDMFHHSRPDGERFHA